MELQGPSTLMKPTNFRLIFLSIALWKSLSSSSSAHLQQWSYLLRFEDAVKETHDAAQHDPSNKELITVVKRAKAMASARLSGNLLFKASKYLEACYVYSEGLEHDPCNSILLSNRAACRSKQGQYEKVVEDCTAVLTVMPFYSKVRLHMADCNAKMGSFDSRLRDADLRKILQKNGMSSQALMVMRQEYGLVILQ